MKLFSRKKAQKAKPAKEATEKAVSAKKAKVVSAKVVSAKVVSAKKARPAKEATEKAAELVVELPPAVEAAGVGGDLADPVSFVATVTLETGELSPVFPPTAVRLSATIFYVSEVLQPWV